MHLITLGAKTLPATHHDRIRLLAFVFEVFMKFGLEVFLGIIVAWAMWMASTLGPRMSVPVGAICFLLGLLFMAPASLDSFVKVPGFPPDAWYVGVLFVMGIVLALGGLILLGLATRKK